MDSVLAHDSDPRTANKRPRAPLLVTLTILVLVIPAGAGDPGLDQSYSIQNFFEWHKSDLDVLIVPPTHGPLVGPGLDPLPYGPEGALPTGTYLAATLTAIESWRFAIQAFAASDPQYAWLAGVEITERVLVVDTITPQDVADADILIVYPEHAGIILGVAVSNGSGIGPRCIAANTLWLTITSPNHYDMYKLAGHEFGHCLGLGHTVGNSPTLDMMSQGGYPNDTHRCPSTLNMMGLVRAFSGTFGEGPGGGTASVPQADYERVCMPGLN